MINEKYWKGYPIPESEIVELSGYSVRHLNNLRTGRKKGSKYYSPVLIAGQHWMKLGGTVVYSQAGKREIMKRRKAAVKQN